MPEHNDSAHVIELSPRDLKRIVEGETVYTTVKEDGGLVEIGFYAEGTEPDMVEESPSSKYDTPPQYTPKLTSKTVQTLIGNGAVKWTDTKTGAELYVGLAERPGSGATVVRELKDAFDPWPETGLEHRSPMQQWEQG